jgi:hypothetical protein
LGLVVTVAAQHHAPELGLDVDAAEVARREKIEQRLDAVGHGSSGVEQQDVLAMKAAGSAADVVADLADKPLLPNRHADPLDEILEPLEEK